MTHNVSRSCIDKIIKVSVDVGLLFSLSSSCAVLSGRPLHYMYKDFPQASG